MEVNTESQDLTCVSVSDLVVSDLSRMVVEFLKAAWVQRMTGRSLLIQSASRTQTRPDKPEGEASSFTFFDLTVSRLSVCFHQCNVTITAIPTGLLCCVLHQSGERTVSFGLHKNNIFTKNSDFIVPGSMLHAFSMLQISQNTPFHLAHTFLTNSDTSSRPLVLLLL